MDDRRVGRAIRALRLRRRWSQAELAARCGVSRATISRLERGLIGPASVALVRTVVAALDADLQLEVRWQGAALDRLLDQGHAAMSGAVTRRLAGSGWAVYPETTFSIYGERGAIDMLAWHAATSTLLVVEIKATLTDAGALLRQIDRYRRLAPAVARDRGLVPRRVSVWVAVRDTRAGRARLAAARTVLRAALPDDGHRVDGWLRAPAGSLAALSFVQIAQGGSTERVVRGGRRSGHARPPG